MSDPDTSYDATSALEATMPSTLSAFAVSFGINAAIAVALLLTFCFLRRKYNFYAPRARLTPDHKIPPLPQSIFSWTASLIRISDDQVLAAAGLDALVLIRTYRFGLQLFLVLCVFAFPVIFTINYTAENGLDNFDQLTMANIPQHSPRLWAHFIGTYLFSAIALVMLNKEYKEFVRLRLYYNQLKAPHTYTIMVKGIPSKEANDHDLKKLFDFMYKGTVHGAVAQRDVNVLDGQYAKRQAYCRSLEHALYVYEHDPKGVRPTHKLGCLGLCGQRVDSIEYYEGKLAKYNQLVREAQERHHPSSGNGFVTFDKMTCATTSLQVLHSQNTEEYEVSPAPEPRDIYWPSLSLSNRIKMIHTLAVGVATFFLVFFYMIPVAFVQTLTSMESLSEHVPGFETLVNQNAALRGFLVGFLPTLALKIFIAILPIICYLLAMFEGNEAYSLIEKSQLAKMFYFQVFNIFLGSLLTGSVFQQISNIVDNPTSIPSLLGKALPVKATFFTNYVMLLSTGLSMSLLRIVPMVIAWFKSTFTARTPKEINEVWTPNPTQFGVLLPEVLLVLCIGLTYSLIAPLCLAFCMLYMAYGYLVYKYLVLYVDVPLYQSGGRFFVLFFNRTVVAIMIMQATMVGLLGLKVSPLAIPLVPAPLLTLVAYWIMKKWHERPSQYIPVLLARSFDESETSVTGDSARELIDPTAYCKPCLKDGLAVPDRWDKDNCLVTQKEGSKGGALPGKDPHTAGRTTTNDSEITVVSEGGSTMGQHLLTDNRQAPEKGT